MKIIGYTWIEGHGTELGRDFYVEDGTFEEYCHVLTHVSLGDYYSDTARLMGEEPIERCCPMSKLSRRDLEDRRLQLHEELFRQSGLSDNIGLSHAFARHKEGVTRDFMNSLDLAVARHKDGWVHRL